MPGPVILQVLPSLTTGGVERGTVEITEAVAHAGWTALVASEGGRMVAEVERAGGRHITLPLRSRGPIGIARNVGRLARMMAAERVAIVDAHSRAPAWSTRFAARRTGVRFVTTYHGAYAEDLPLKRHYNAIMAQGEVVIVASRFIAKLVQERHGVSPTRIRVISRGIDPAVFDPAAVTPGRVTRLRAEWQLPDGAPVMLLPGRLTSWKGQEVLIDAAARLGRSDAHIVFAGSDQGRHAYAEGLRRRAARVGLGDRLHLVGDYADMPAALSVADLVIHASTEPEAFGRVVIEALAMERPVIAADLGGPAETVTQGVTGWRVPPGDPVALAAAIDHALALSEAARREFGARGRADVLARFTLAGMQAATLAVYRELLGQDCPRVAVFPIDAIQIRSPYRMPAITLPDGSVRRFDGAVAGTTIAEAIGPGLARAALAMRVDGKLVDLDTAIDRDASVVFITRRDPEALELIRHDAAHVLAEAVQDLFPGTQVTIGPPIEDGFYYDFARHEPFTPEDFVPIEARMREIIARGAPFRRREVDRDEAIAFFEAKGEKYKAELIRDLPESETVSLYSQGDWIDLCRGPHMRTTADVGPAFKLMKVAGAYWRGDHRNAMLSRIYGTAWRDQKELDAYLTMLEEAERRDHRRIGKEMDLFHFQEEAVGSIFWHPKGWRLYRTAEDYMRRRLNAAGYQEVRTPQLLDRVFWERSGHWKNYREHMFIATVEEENKTLALKPMNCPCHVQIFRQRIRSYRELPLRLSEFGSCHRYEPSGALQGIMRLRAFTQDDAHIFCTEDQIAPETARFVELLRSIYADFGFPEVRIRFADRPAVRTGSDEVWDKAEQALRDACEIAGVSYDLHPGDGAFYGPKLDFHLHDAIGREWQCGTLQVDPNLPELLDAEYVAEDGSRRRPFMLHRAILGSFERFLGVLIEHYAGRFPLWLAPIQVVVATIVSDADDFAREAAAALQAAGLNVELDLTNQKINAKVRTHSLAHVPVMAIVGRREAEARSLAIRRLGADLQEILPLDQAVARLAREATPPDLRRLRHASPDDREAA